MIESVCGAFNLLFSKTMRLEKSFLHIIKIFLQLTHIVGSVHA